MFCRFVALLVASATLCLSGCSLFAPKPVPQRYRAEPYYPPVRTPVSYPSQAASRSSTPAPPPPAPAPAPKPSREKMVSQAERNEPAPQPRRQEKEVEEEPVPEIDLESLPFGIPVPGEPYVVTLPKQFDSDVEIDVTGIDPGTPVEIPDPNRPGKTIQFRVPEF